MNDNSLSGLFPYFGKQRSSAVTLQSIMPTHARWQNVWQDVVKLRVRAWMNAAVTREWLGLLNSDPLFEEFIRVNPRFLHKIYRPYLTSHLSIRERLDALRFHYEMLLKLGIRPMLVNAAHTGSTVARTAGRSGTEYRIVMRAGAPLEREGELVLQLWRTETLVYSTAFTLCVIDDLPAIRIGCIQGPKGEDGLALIRLATHDLHGCRPKQMLVNLVSHLGHHLGCRDMHLVGNRNRVAHVALSKGRVHADYEQLWRELSAEPLHSGDFHLTCQPLQEPDMANIASSKRSAARKRHAHMTMLAAELVTHFPAPGKPQRPDGATNCSQ